MLPDMRVLGRVRLSRLSDGSTSVERQTEQIEAWAKAQGHEVVGIAVDVDVSGAVSPFDAPALGPWLTAERLGEWDVLCAAALDRVARRAIPMNQLFGLLLDNGKSLVCIRDTFDLSTWVGRLVANVIAGVAEGELEAIKARAKGSQKKLRESGRLAGRTAYGYRKVPVDGGGFRIEPDPVTGAVVHRIVRDVLAGQSVESIASALNTEGVQTPSVSEGWRGQSIRKMLRSRTLLAHVTHDGVTVRDESGDPVLKGVPLLDTVTFDRVQAVLESRSFTKSSNRSSGASAVLGVAVCFDCDGNLHHRAQTTRTHRDGCVLRGQATDCGCPTGKEYRYYYCRACGGAQIRAEEVEGSLEELLLAEVGSERERIPVYVPASDATAQLGECVQAVAELSAALGSVKSNTVRDQLLSQLAVLDDRIAVLEAAPVSAGGWDYRLGDRTYAEAWAESDTEGRRQLLIRSGIKLRIKRLPGTQAIMAEFWTPDNLLSRIASNGTQDEMTDIDIERIQKRDSESAALRRQYGISDD